MYPDLMHPASEWSAQDNTGLPVVVHPLKFGPALLTLRGHLQEKIYPNLSQNVSVEYIIHRGTKKPYKFGSIL